MVNQRSALYWKKVLGLYGLITFGGPFARLCSADQAIPDWSAWTCSKPIISFDVIETDECHPPKGEQKTSIILKIKGADIPFLIGWGYVERAEKPGANAYTALYKDGRWIVGSIGTGFTAKDNGASILFSIFLTPDFSVREQIEIKLPESE